jgi:tetratricopeptide (TPR) repeat protein
MMEFSFLLVLAFAIYGFCLNGECVFDDVNQIINNPNIIQGNWRAALFDNHTAWKMRLHTLIFGWRTMVRGSLALNIAVWGPSTFSIHVTNVVLHAMNGYLVMHIAGTLGFDQTIALLAGAFFIGHPLAVSSVAYMSSRGVLLSALFSNAAILSMLSGYWLLSMPLAVLALMAKEDAAILPAALTALALERGMPGWWAPLPVVAVLLWMKRRNIRELIRGNGNKGMTASGFAEQLQQPWYSLTAFTETVLRFPQWILGSGMNFDPQVCIPGPARLAAAMTLFLAFAGAMLAAGPMAHVVLILIVLSPAILYWFVPMPDPVMEYRFYGSLTGVAVALAAVFNLAGWPMVLCAAAVLWTIAGIRAMDFSTALALWKGVLRDGSEHERALLNLGAAYQFRQEHAAAQKCFERVLAKNPHIGPAWANLGLIEVAYERYDKAIEYFTNATVHCPKFPHGWQALAQVYQKLNQPEKAQSCLKAMELAAKG